MHVVCINIEIFSRDDTPTLVLNLAYQQAPLTSIWPHLNSDVGLDEGEY